MGARMRTESVPLKVSDMILACVCVIVIIWKRRVSIRGTVSACGGIWMPCGNMMLISASWLYLDQYKLVASCCLDTVV